MIMEKGISSVEGVPSKSSHVAAVMVKEHEAKPAPKVRRVGFVLVHAGKDTTYELATCGMWQSMFIFDALR